MTEYIKVFWTHEPDEYPVVILYEVASNNKRLALRSINIFADGKVENIEDCYERTVEVMPIPTVDELNSDFWGDEIRACLIDQAEFFAVWESHFYDGVLT